MLITEWILLVLSLLALLLILASVFFDLSIQMVFENSSDPAKNKYFSISGLHIGVGIFLLVLLGFLFFGAPNAAG